MRFGAPPLSGPLPAITFLRSARLWLQDCGEWFPAVETKQNSIGRMSFMRILSALALVCAGIVGLSATINAADAPARRDRRDLREDRADRNHDVKDLRKDKADAQSDRQDIKTDVKNVRSDRQDLRKDRADVRGDRADLRKDGKELQEDRQGLRQDL